MTILFKIYDFDQIPVNSRQNFTKIQKFPGIPNGNLWSRESQELPNENSRWPWSLVTINELHVGKDVIWAGEGDIFRPLPPGFSREKTD